MTETQITLLEKPFKISHLLKELGNLLSTNTYQNSKIFLMNDLKFLPYEKVLINLSTLKTKNILPKKKINSFYIFAVIKTLN